MKRLPYIVGLIRFLSIVNNQNQHRYRDLKMHNARYTTLLLKSTIWWAYRKFFHLLFKANVLMIMLAISCYLSLIFWYLLLSANFWFISSYKSRPLFKDVYNTIDIIICCISKKSRTNGHLDGWIFLHVVYLLFFKN